MRKINFLVCLILFGLTTIKAQTTQATNTVTNENSYLGTSNSFDVIFKRENIKSGLIAVNKTSFGLNSFASPGGVSIGVNAGLNSSSEMGHNIYVGENAGSGYMTTNFGIENTVVGTNAFSNNSTGNFNIALGFGAGRSNSTGSENIFIGNGSGCEDDTEVNGCIFIGSYSGFTNLESNKLMIDNGETNAPLIWGDMENDKLKFHSKVGIGGSGNNDINFGNFPTTAGSVNVSNYNLFVKGGILTEEVRVSLQSTWADYVFAKEYQLPTLNEVENHIKEKGHLINVPSAKEVKENGIELGEMAKIQQEKIEELTLYIIELNKKLEAQDKRLNELEKKK